MKLDFVEQDKLLYSPNQDPQVVNVPVMQYIMYDGSGRPTNNQSFRDAFKALVGVAYTIKFMPRNGDMIPGFYDFKVPPPEALWWMEGREGFDTGRPKDWRWTLMIRMPEFVTPIVGDTAILELAMKKHEDIYKKVRLGQLNEGQAVQVMHIGSYADEETSLEKMAEYAAEHNLLFRGKHHEIYFSNPNRTKPEKLKTLLRHPVVTV